MNNFQSRLILLMDDIHPALKKGLEWAGFSVEHFISEDQLQHSLGWVVRSRYQLTASWIDKAPQLRFIARAGSGTENIDVDYAKKKGIEVFNSPEANRDAVAEHALGMLLSMMNHLFRCNSEVKQRIWQRKENWGNEIKGKTIGIIGYGNVGSTFAKKLSSFECNILAYDKYKQHFGNSYVIETSLEEIFSHADIVSLHVPLTEETKYMADEKFFSRFRKPIWFINTSRGAVCKSEALLKALQAGQVRGAALDVLEWEDDSFEKFSLSHLPPLFNELVQMDNVILSPHVAGWTYEAYEKHAFILLKKIVLWANLALNIHIDYEQLVQKITFTP